MVQLRMIVLDPKPELMLPSDPRHVGIADVLVIAKQKGIARVGIAEVGKGVELECRYASLQQVGTVRARYMQRVQTKIAANVQALPNCPPNVALPSAAPRAGGSKMWLRDSE